jgi:mRNA interferase MazF
LKKGDVVIVPGGSDYGKVRPAIVVQADAVTRVWNSVVVCPLSSHPTAIETFARISLKPSKANGLRLPSQIMVDKITTYPLDRVRGPIGRIDDKSIEALNVSLVLLLGLWSTNPN